jgi:hypothetical protein
METIEYDTIDHELGEISYVVCYVKEDNISTALANNLKPEISDNLYLKFEVEFVRITLAEDESILFNPNRKNHKCNICKKDEKCMVLRGEKRSDRGMWHRGKIYCCKNCVDYIRDFRDSILGDIGPEDITSSII